MPGSAAADPSPAPSTALGTGEGHLRYGIDTRCSKRLPGVRDAFSEALGAQNRLLWYRRDIRCMKTPFFCTEGVHSEELGAQNRLLRYGRDIRCAEQPPLVRDASSVRETAPALFVRSGGPFPCYFDGTRYRRGPPMVRNMRAVLKKASWGTRCVFRGTRCAKQAPVVQKRYSVHETPLFLHGRRFQRNSVLKTGSCGTRRIFKGPQNSRLHRLWTASCRTGRIFSARNGPRSEVSSS